MTEPTEEAKGRPFPERGSRARSAEHRADLKAITERGRRSHNLTNRKVDLNALSRRRRPAG